MSGCLLQEIDLEVYLQDTHWGVLLRTTPVRNCRKQDWVGREINGVKGVVSQAAV